MGCYLHLFGLVHDGVDALLSLNEQLWKYIKKNTWDLKPKFMKQTCYDAYYISKNEQLGNKRYTSEF